MLRLKLYFGNKIISPNTIMEATAKTLRNKHRSTQLTYLNTWDRNPMKLYAMVEVNDDQELLMNQCQHPGKIEFDKSWWTRRWNLRTDSTLDQIKQSTNVAIPIIQDSTVLPNIEPTHAIIQDSTVLPNIEPTHNNPDLGKTATFPESNANVAIPIIQDSMVLPNIEPTHAIIQDSTL